MVAQSVSYHKYRIATAMNTNDLDWHNRWKHNEIGFHLEQTNPMLLKHWHTLQAMPNDPVLVPLCGKSLDLLEIQRQGQYVIGCELSEIAIESFFAEHGLSYEQHIKGEHKYYSAKGLTLIQGDFFTLPEASISARFVYDRAALVALEPKQQIAYVEQLLRSAPVIERMLLITVDYDKNKDVAPPFRTPPEQVNALYGDHFTIELLETRENKASPGKQQQGLNVITEHAFKLDRK